MMFDAIAVEKIIGYSFKDKTLLRKCFTHSSYANEHGEESNERLEFFGDAILELIVTEYLFCSNVQREGVLTDLRQRFVSQKPLLFLVKRTGLSEYVLLGKGQEKTVRSNEKLFSSVYEALVAGIYIDGGMHAAKTFVDKTLLSGCNNGEYCINDEAMYYPEADACLKTRLQEFVQGHRLGKISYEMIEKCGPEHEPVFSFYVCLNGKPLAEGKGKNKRAAQSRAAAIALDFLEKQEGNRG